MLPTNINSLEKNKFEEVGGQVCVRVTGTISTGAASGGATEANQDAQIILETAMAGYLASIDAGTPAALGQTTMANSIPVAIASNQTAVPISAAALPLPTGAATESTLTSIDAGIPAALGQATMANSMPVVISSNQTAVPVSDSTAQASLSVLDDWDESDRAKVNPIAGQAGVQGGSGAVSALTQRMVLATDVALPAGTNAIGSVVSIPATSGGCDVKYILSAATNNATSVKASAGQVYGIYVSHNGASPVYLKFYNKASAPTPASDTVIATLEIPGTATGNAGAIPFPPQGVPFSTGIACAIVAGISNTDNTSINANETIVIIFYK